MLLIDTTTERESAPAHAKRERSERRRQLLRDAGLVVGILSILTGIALAIFVLPGALDDVEATGESASTGTTAVAAAPTAAEAKGVKFEKFERVDPALPAIPPGAVKKFKVDVYEHVTKVSDDLAPTEVWSYAINGVEHRGTGVSEPMVVEVGDRVRIDLVNGSSERMSVRSTRARPSRRSRPAASTASSSRRSTRACSCTTAPPTRCCTTRALAWSAR
jgi:hypothetical protein